GEVVSAALAEDVLLEAAAAADVQAHVLDDAEHGHVHLLEHLETLARVGERDVLRRRHDHDAAHGHALRERELDVAGAWRHVDDQVIEVAPARLREELVQRRRHHRTAPRHRLLFVDEETDRHGLNAVRHERLEQLAVARLGTAAYQAQHARLAGTVDIGVEQPDARALAGKREREIHGHRGLADTALARCHGDEVVNARQRLEPVLHGVRGYGARDLELERLPVDSCAAVHAQRLDERGRTAPERKTEAQSHVPRATAPLDLEARPG